MMYKYKIHKFDKKNKTYLKKIKYKYKLKLLNINIFI